MKKLLKAIAVVAVLALSVTVFAACSNSGQGNEVVSNDGSSDASTVESNAGDNKTADLSNPDITINSGDYEAMQTFATSMQTKENEGKVVKVTGINSRSNFGAKASVMESNGDGQKIGTTYKITGVDSINGYPADDANIELTGVVKVDDNGISCYIEVAPENLKTID